jgi:hypothetical protein
MMKPILVEQILNILINYRTLKLLHFLTICWDFVHLSIAGYVCVSIYINTYVCVCVCVCVFCEGSGPWEIGGNKINP